VEAAARETSERGIQRYRPAGPRSHRVEDRSREDEKRAAIYNVLKDSMS